jgi:hypothetical protein
MGVNGRKDVGNHLIFFLRTKPIFKNGTAENRGTMTKADIETDTKWWK